MLTDASGSTTVRRYDYEPFGPEIPSGYGGRTPGMGYLTVPDDLSPKFTSQNRDVETAMDWFQVRHMSGAQGRFQSVDPGNAGADPSNPQTWNAYAYVGNNPLSYTDPFGESWWTLLIGIGLDIAGIFTGGATTTWGTILTTAGTVATGGSIGGGIIGDISGGVNSSQPWNEQIPIGDGFGGGLNAGGAFGSGNTGPFVFSFDDGWSNPDTGNFYGGMFDSIMFGAGPWIRNKLPGPTTVDPNSAAYKAGNYGAMVAGAITGAGEFSAGRAIGPLTQWFRLGKSYSGSLGQNIEYSARWGASSAKGGKYLNQIGSPTLRSFNQWLRSQRLPLPGWRAADPGHLHIWEKLPTWWPWK